MRTPARVASALVAFAASFPIGMPAASAATTTQLPVAISNWFWEKQTGGAAPGVGAGMPAINPAASGIKAGNLAVAVQPTEEKPQGDLDKETFLSFDVSPIPAGSIVDSFTFTLAEDTAERQQDPVVTAAGTGAVGQPGVIVACRPLGAFSGGPGAESFAGKPDEDCADAPSGQYDAVAKTFTFDLTLVAQKWVDGTELNLGVAIRNAPDFVHPFQYSFLPASTVKANVTYSPKPDVYVPPVDPPTAPDTGYVPAPDTGGYVPQPQPQAPAQPRQPVVPVVQAPRPIAPVAAVPFVQDSTPTRSFWAGALAGVLLLGVASLVLGDAVAAPVAARRETKLDRVLRSRAAASAPPAPGAHPRVV